MSDSVKQAVRQAQADYSFRQRRNFAIFQLGLWVEGVLRGRVKLGLLPFLAQTHQLDRVLSYLCEAEALSVRVAVLESWVDREARGKLKELLTKELEVAKEQANKIQIHDLLQENSDLIRGLIAAKVPRKRVAFLISQATGVAVSDRVLAKFLSALVSPQPAPEPSGETAETPAPKPPELVPEPATELQQITPEKDGENDSDRYW